jgi:hypothetical protein
VWQPCPRVAASDHLQEKSRQRGRGRGGGCKEQYNSQGRGICNAASYRTPVTVHSSEDRPPEAASAGLQSTLN